MTATLTATVDWDQAACLKAEPETFFPENGGPVDEAKRICCHCPIRQECLEYALTHSNENQHGVWGGLSARERKTLRAMAGMGGKPPVECGTPSGYQRHKDRSEDACEPCRRARNEQKNQWRRDAKLRGAA